MYEEKRCISCFLIWCVFVPWQAEDAREAETRKLRDELSQRDAELHEARREADALRRKLPHGASDVRPTKAAEPEAHPAVSGAGRVVFGGEAEGGEKEAKARQVEASLRERVRQLEQALATAQEERKVEGEQAEEDVAQVRGPGKGA